MRNISKSLLAAFLFFFISLALGSGMAPGLREVRAESGGAQSVDIIIELNGLRDKVAGNWALIMKYGWNASGVLEDPYHEERPQSPREDLASLEILLKQCPPGDPSQTEQLVQAIDRLHLAEKAYAEAINQVRNSATNPLLASLLISQLNYSVTSKADELFHGVKPLVLISDSSPINSMSDFGFKPVSPEEMHAWKIPS